jgi:predicted O-methyltransferase YrrM
MEKAAAAILSKLRRIRDYFLPVAASAPAGAAVDVSPIVDIPFPKIDFITTTNPIPAILTAENFAQTSEFFTNSPAAKRSLVSGLSQALIYAVIRNQRPLHVAEIGTFRGGTTEAMSRAVLANGSGAVHTVGPFDGKLFPSVLAHWPIELRAPVTFYPINSMSFFMEMERLRISHGLVLVDGNHDYEFALFDIQCAARRLTPGGFIFVDNVAQAGPYFAAVDFLIRNPDWIDCGLSSNVRDRTRAFDRSRSNVPGTDFMVLRAPTCYIVGERPRSFGETLWHRPLVSGLRLSLDGQHKSGTLYAQCVLRGFTDTLQVEVFAQVSRQILPGTTDLEVTFENPAMLGAICSQYRVEPWLIWIGEGPLRLNAIPIPI